MNITRCNRYSLSILNYFCELIDVSYDVVLLDNYGPHTPNVLSIHIQRRRNEDIWMNAKSQRNVRCSSQFLHIYKEGSYGCKSNSFTSWVSPLYFKGIRNSCLRRWWLHFFRRNDDMDTFIESFWIVTAVKQN